MRRKITRTRNSLLALLTIANFTTFNLNTSYAQTLQTVTDNGNTITRASGNFLNFHHFKMSWAIYIDSGGFYLKNTSDDTYPFMSSTAGYFGLGTTAPDHKLHIDALTSGNLFRLNSTHGSPKWLKFTSASTEMGSIEGISNDLRINSYGDIILRSGYWGNRKCGYRY